MTTVHVFTSGALLGPGQTVSVASCRTMQMVEALLPLGAGIVVSPPNSVAEPDASRQGVRLRESGATAALWLMPEDFSLPPYALPGVRRLCDLAGIADAGVEAVRTAWAGAVVDAGFVLDGGQADLARAVLPPATPLRRLPADCPAPLRVARAPVAGTVLVPGDLNALAPWAPAFAGLSGRLAEAGWRVVLLHLPPVPSPSPAGWAAPAGAELVTAPVLETVQAALAAATVVIDPYPFCGEPYLATAMRRAVCARNGIGVLEWNGPEDTPRLLQALASGGPFPVPPVPDEDGASALRSAVGTVSAPAIRPAPGRLMDTLLLVAGGPQGRKQAERLLPVFASLVRRGRLDRVTVVHEESHGEGATSEPPAIARYGRPGTGDFFDAVLVCGTPGRAMAESILLTTERHALHLETAPGAEAGLRRLLGPRAVLCGPSAGVAARAGGRPADFCVLPPGVDLPAAPPPRGGRPVAMAIDATGGLPVGPSKGAILAAVAKASLRHGLPLLWFGPPDDAFCRHVGDVRLQSAATRPAILAALLQSGPLIGLGPAEESDAGPSDDRMALFGATGHVGVYSACPAFAFSTLRAGLVVPNEEGAWLEAIGRLCADSGPAVRFDPAAIRMERSLDHIADRCAAALLERARLGAPAALDALLTHRRIYLDAARRLPFDEQGYLADNPDVRAAVLSGHFPDGYTHFLLCGMAEGRAPDYAPRDELEFAEVVAGEIQACDSQLAAVRQFLNAVLPALSGPR